MSCAPVFITTATGSPNIGHGSVIAQQGDRTTMRMTAQTWGLILAGGEGLRLRPLTRLITGDERPKQFCKIVGQDLADDGAFMRHVAKLAQRPGISRPGADI